MIGSRLAHYDISAHIGSGGMGDVYQATDLKLGRSVALKFLPEVLAKEKERAARFEREARVLAMLNHPHIAAIYGLEQSGERNFLVMEYVAGETLAQRIARGAMPIEEALKMGRQIAEALDAAHEKGIVHRDLKPANIKITPEGNVKVLDFGLAKALSIEAENPHLSNSPTMLSASMPGTILGTAAYMSPEQAKGNVLDRRTDVFALGCVLYEMLTGSQAFSGNSVAEILTAVLKVEPDWNRLPNDTPAPIRRLLRRCLQKQPRRRLQTAADVRNELEDWQQEPDLTEHPLAAPSRTKRERVAWALAGVLLLAGLVQLAQRYFESSRAGPGEIRLDLVTPLTTTPESFASFTLSPDGKQIAFVASEAGQRLYVRPLNSQTAQQIPGTEGASFPFWSPDSLSIGFFAEGNLKRIDLGGGLPRTLAAAPLGRGGAWGDGVIVFAASTLAPLSRVPASGGAVIPATKLEPAIWTHTMHISRADIICIATPRTPWSAARRISRKRSLTTRTTLLLTKAWRRITTCSSCCCINPRGNISISQDLLRAMRWHSTREPLKRAAFSLAPLQC
jgi:serine/threonine protein kinase